MAASKSYPQLVLFGDSLFQGSCEVQDGFSFQAALQAKFMRRLDVVNRGFSGYNTANALKYLPEIFAPPSEGLPRIAYLVILLGANDAVKPMPTTTQHVPLEQYRSNMVKIMTHPVIAAHAPQILVVTPPPLDEIKIARVDQANGHAGPTREARVSAAYTAAAHEAAAQVPGAMVVDLWQAIMDRAAADEPGFARPEGGCRGHSWLGDPACGKQGGLDRLLPDGLHMSGEAYRVFYELLVPYVGREWAGLAPEDRAGYVFPDWSIINPPS